MRLLRRQPRITIVGKNQLKKKQHREEKETLHLQVSGEVVFNAVRSKAFM